MTLKRIRRTMAIGLIISVSLTRQTAAQSIADRSFAAPTSARSASERPTQSWGDFTALRAPLSHLVVTSPFGMRFNPVMRRPVFHSGIDYGAPSGAPVYAAGSGVVEAAGESSHSGIFVRIRHNRAVETVYAHLHRIMPGLRAGSVLRGGDVLGFVGASGFATGPHLHFELLVNGKPVDPAGADVPHLVQLAALSRR
ncbi:MAG: family peptidase [Nevskia sp.]|nr:family peptidase [Nevskia sp.]